MKLIVNSLLICILLTNNLYASSGRYSQIRKEVEQEVQSKLPQAKLMIDGIIQNLERSQPTNLVEVLEVLNQEERVALTGALVQELNNIITNTPNKFDTTDIANVLGIAGFTSIIIGVSTSIVPQEGSRKWNNFWDNHTRHVLGAGVVLLAAALFILVTADRSVQDERYKNISLIDLRDILNEKYEAEIKAMARERLTNK